MNFAVILAAGEGSRLGGACKATLEHPSGLTFLEHIVGICRKLAVQPIVVAGGSYLSQVAAHAESLGVQMEVNSNAKDGGMSSSIEIGFQSLANKNGDGALLWPVDHGFVQLETVQKLLQQEGEVVVPVFAGRGGHPTFFKNSTWKQLSRCAALPRGARSVVENASVVRVEVQDRGVVNDIDCPADLEGKRAGK